MRLLVLSLCLLAAPAALAQDAQRPPDVLNRVYNCVEIADDAQRLACFDAAVGRLQQAARQGEFAAVDRARAQEVERDSFGFNIPSLLGLIPRAGGDESSRLDNVQMTVERVTERANGRLSFIMTNGQVWAQTETARRGDVRVGDIVTVRRAAMGTYFLAPQHGGAPHRVRREN